MKIISNKSIAVVVLSCDKYSDLWKPFFYSFLKFWPGIECPIYLFSNTKSYQSDDARIKTVLSGNDKDWSSSILRCLRQVEEDYLVLFFDDVFLSKRVDEKKFYGLLEEALNFNFEYLRFRPVPLPDTEISQQIGRIHEGTLYRSSVFAVWRRDVLMDLLKEGESAWQFEIVGSERTRKYRNFFGVYTDYFDYIHGVEKGMWYPQAMLQLIKLGIPVDVNARKSLSTLQSLQSRFRLLRASILNMSPPHLRPKMMKLSQLIREKVFSQW